jgi:hypothetical protein
MTINFKRLTGSGHGLPLTTQCAEPVGQSIQGHSQVGEEGIGLSLRKLASDLHGSLRISQRLLVAVQHARC